MSEGTPIFDPVVAAALEQIVPAVRVDADEMLRRARQQLPERNRRSVRTRRLANIL